MKAAILAVAVASVLAGCAGTAFSPTPQYGRAVQRAKTGNPEDVRFCEYEANKMANTSNNYNYLMQAVENQEQRMRVFNACMDYRSK